uniref:Glycine N-acyltransferase-like protein n=1 Tax=Anolis carolinensis TaxID=28377 RepID=A0A803TVS9_ANOCA
RLGGVQGVYFPQTPPVFTFGHIEYLLVVDSWPEFKTVLTPLCYLLQVIKNKLDFYANLHAAFYSDMDSCQALLENEDSIDWGRAFQMQGEYRQLKNKHLGWIAFCLLTHPYLFLFFRFKSDLLHFGTLKPSHASSLNDVWDFGGNDRSLCYLESLIRNFPSACLLDKEGQLAAWCLIDPYGCLTHGYTFPQYRGQGWIGLILQNLGRQMHALGFPLYAAVLAENEPSIRSLLNQGFHILPGTYYTLISTPVPNPKH